MTGFGPAARVLTGVVAIGIGAGIAYWHRNAPPEPVAGPAAEAPATTVEGPASAAPRPGGHAERPSHADRTAASDPGAAGAGGPPRPAPARTPDEDPPPPAPLPAFLADGLGPPPREPDGSLAEGSPHALQARLDGERRDDAWADKVEWELENYLGLQPFTERLETRAVLCRATVCRVTATTRRSALPESPEDGWQAMMASLRYERVSNEFERSADVLVFKASEPDRVGFVTYFEREEREE